MLCGGRSFDASSPHRFPPDDTVHFVAQNQQLKEIVPRGTIRLSTHPHQIAALPAGFCTFTFAK
jgi:hypothetical protein